MGMSSGATPGVPALSLGKMLVPLALAQFICSFAGSNMNVMINDISHDLHTDVQGVQVCITGVPLEQSAQLHWAVRWLGASPSASTAMTSSRKGRVRSCSVMANSRSQAWMR